MMPWKVSEPLQYRQGIAQNGFAVQYSHDINTMQLGDQSQAQILRHSCESKPPSEA